MNNVIYPYDPTGTNPACRITGEQHVMTAANYRDFHYIIPKAAPFFEESLTLAAKAPDGTILNLVKGVHYYLTHEFIGASRACAKPIYASITFLYTDFAGVINLSYQTVGGSWTLDETAVAEILANSLLNPRTTSWEQVAGYPAQFPVVDHAWNLVDMVGMSEVRQSLDEIRDAILATSDSKLPEHLADTNNPHSVTKTQVGLSQVQNYPPSSQTQAEGGANNSSYMTPLRVTQALAVAVPTLMAVHTDNNNNPHGVTKAQVGLGNVMNYGVATNAEVIAGTSQALYVTPAGVKAALESAVAGSGTHITDYNNPHGVTAVQVGLGSVMNYPIATSTEAMTGTANDRYMTPLRTAQAIAQISTTALVTHTSNKANPHETTKSQVGLGNVDNFATATQAQALDESYNAAFMTPMRTAQAIAAQVGDDFILHINADNPHNVTKADIGLSNVMNYGVASDAEAVTAGVTNKYMTPRGVSLAIAAVIGNSSVGDHVLNYNNPHNVSKAQVGLGNVDNFSTASDSEAAIGTANNRFMTPSSTRTAVNSLLNTHIQDSSNPHNVTKAQVGLGNVMNYDSASTAETVGGGSSTLYTTAAGVKLYVEAAIAPFVQHSARMDNPHNTTKTQVGLGNVENYPVASQPEAEQGIAMDRYMTPAAVAAAIIVQGGALINDFASRRDNPNQVTASQVNAYDKSEVDAMLQARDNLIQQLNQQYALIRHDFDEYKVFMAQQIQTLSDLIGAG